MRVSEYYELKLTQPSLDFVDVDISKDTPVFIDPWALRICPGAWVGECVALVRDFFHTVLAHSRAKEHQQARDLLLVLHEPNETRLGLSRGKRAHGRGLGDLLANEVYSRLSDSKALTSGMLEDLEDTLLFIDGIGPDIISDITSNIIRGPLIRYTQSTCSSMGIPMKNGVAAGPMWNPADHSWAADAFVEMPVSKEGKHLFVPKTIVRKRLEYDVEEYYRHYLLEHIKSTALAANSQFVHLLKKGGKRVYKVELEEEYPLSKALLLKITLQSPEILERYHADKKTAPKLNPLTHYEIAASAGNGFAPDWDALLKNVLDVQPGKTDAPEYEKTVQAFFTALFYPWLNFPNPQSQLHNGRKRVDIEFTNSATAGFWYWLGQHYNAPYVWVECKNYRGEVANAELDQLSGRFSRERGTFGLLICRDFDEKERFIQRCHDTVADGRGFVVPLDDTDLRAIVNAIKGKNDGEFTLLRERFGRIVK